MLRCGLGDVVCIWGNIPCCCVGACVLFSRWQAAPGPWADSPACHRLTDTSRVAGRTRSIQICERRGPSVGRRILSGACQSLSRLSFRLHCVPPLLLTSAPVMSGLTLIASTSVFLQLWLIFPSCGSRSQKRNRQNNGGGGGWGLWCVWRQKHRNHRLFTGTLTTSLASTSLD